MTRGLLDGPALAEALHLHPATIRQWAHRRHITRRGTDPQGRALYNMLEVDDYVQQSATVTPRNAGEPCPKPR